ncbi:MAG: LPXTG cell wall anchor domain-containing protein [Clostridia bacterium]|nr:LPXTG cell wall anchor domain-containing protein [Clostridia bacterium]
MKQLKKLAFVMILLLQVGLCACALAQEVQTATITVHMINEETGGPGGRSVRLFHADCLDHRPDWKKPYCDCLLCPCGNDWYGDNDPATVSFEDRHVAQHGKTMTFTIQKGHVYTITSSHGIDYYPVEYGYKRKVRRVIDWYNQDEIVIYTVNDPQKTNLNANGKNEVTFVFKPFYTPVDFKLAATKTMDGRDPGGQTFRFNMWELTQEQADLFLNDDLNFGDVLTPEIFPEIPPEAWEDMEWAPPPEYADEFREFLQREIPRRAMKLLRDELDTCPVLKTISNQGKNVPFVSTQFTFYDMDQDYAGRKYTQRYYAFAEVTESGQPVCYDDSIYIMALNVHTDYIPTPVSLDEEEDEYYFSKDDVQEDRRQYSRQLTATIDEMVKFSSAEGRQYWYRPTDAELEQTFVFRNRTCPFYNPPAAPETPAAPAVPQTGDNSPILVWLALACISGMALLGMNRKKA